MAFEFRATKNADIGAKPSEIRVFGYVGLWLDGASWLSFVVIKRRGNCGLLPPGDDNERRVDTRKTVPLSRRLRA